MDALKTRWKRMDSTVRTTVLIITVVVVVLIVLLIVRQIVSKNKRVNRRGDSSGDQSHSSVIDASQSSGFNSASSSARDGSRHQVRGVNDVVHQEQGPAVNAGRPTQFQQGASVQAHQAVNSQKLVGTANLVQPTCPGGCGGNHAAPAVSQHQVHASQGGIHQPSEVPNYGARMAQRRQFQQQQVNAAQPSHGQKENFQQWAESGNETSPEDQQVVEPEHHDDSPRPKSSRFASKNADD